MKEERHYHEGRKMQEDLGQDARLNFLLCRYGETDSFPNREQNSQLQLWPWSGAQLLPAWEWRGANG